MAFLKSSIIIMRYDFKSESCFSGVLKYPGLPVVGELGADDTKKPWFLLLVFLPLPLAIWLSLVLAGLAICDSVLYLLQGYVSVLLVDQFFLGRIKVGRAVAQGQLQGAVGNWKYPVPGCSSVPVS